MTSAARLEATAALRDLVHVIVAADADDATLARTAAIVRDAVAELEHAPRGRVEGSRLLRGRRGT